jgi:hypothetical protein
VALRLFSKAVFFVCALAVCSAAAPAQDSGAAALMAKHRVFAGWQLGDGTFKTLRLTRRYVKSSGENGALSVQLRAGLIYRDAETSSTSRAGQGGFTGSLFWRTSWNGFTTPVYGDLAKYQLTVDAFQNEGLGSHIRSSG